MGPWRQYLQSQSGTSYLSLKARLESLRRGFFSAGEMVPSMKGLPCNREELMFGPQDPHFNNANVAQQAGSAGSLAWDQFFFLSR